jgi:hypothetical protein
LNDVRSTVFTLGGYERDVFTEFATHQFVESSESPDWDTCPLDVATAGRKRLRVDAYGFDDVEKAAFLLVTDYSAEEEITSITKTELDTLFQSLSNFVSAAFEGSKQTDIPHTEEAAVAAENLFSKQHVIEKFRFYLATNRRLSDRVKNIPQGSIAGTPIEFQVWDIGRFHELHESRLGREELRVQLTDWLPTGLKTLRARDATKGIATYLAVVPGIILAQIFDKYGSRLLEGNVRSFLSARGNVNKGIRNTVLNRPELFLPFNNGITATASIVELSSDMSAITAIHDLQIVNGGQTTATLYNFLKNEKEHSRKLNDADVQMKLVVVDDSVAEDLVPDIAKFANSQNKVSEADFFSNSAFHRRMEEISKRIFAPARRGSQIQTHWFYERARGSFLNERARHSGQAATRFTSVNPRAQLITKTDMAKFHSSWNQRPHMVSKGAQKNFLDFANVVAEKFESEQGRLDFGDEFYKEVVCKKILFDGLSTAVKATDWYETGYLANIVAYGISRLSFELSKLKLDLNWGQIWKDQEVPPSLMQALLDCAYVAKQGLTYQLRPQQNVTEWAKTEACWKHIQGIPVEIGPDFRNNLASKEQSLEAGIESRAKTKQLGELERITFLAGIPTDRWRETLVQNSHSISPTERSIVSLMISKGAFTLSPLQGEKIVAMISRLRSDGYEI